MPKPFVEYTGNGCHVHLSLWDTATSQPVFEADSDAKGLDFGLSSEAYSWL